MINELEKDIFEEGQTVTIYVQGGNYIIGIMNILVINDTCIKFYDYNISDKIICLNPETILRYEYYYQETEEPCF